MRIIHAAIFNTFKYGKEYYSMDRKISNGLIRNGHFVYDFSYRDICRGENFFKTTKYGSAKLNARLVDTVASVQPELLLLGHSELIEPDTLKKIKQLQPGIKIGMWYIDPLFHTHHIQHILERKELLDVFFVTTGGELLQQYKTRDNVVSFLPNISDSSVDINQNHQSDDFAVDFVFGGSDYKEPERQSFLKHLFSELGKTMRCELWGALGNPFYLDHQFVVKLSQTKMGLNYSRRNDVYLYTSNRITHLTGNGILTFSPKVPGLIDVYDESEIVYFDDTNDLIEKVNYFHANDAQRKTIAENGWLRTHESYNSKRVTQFMLELLFNLDFSDDYEWTDEILR